jgi:signal transduction histidine kinase
MQAVQAYALAGALSLGTLALLHTLVWREQRQRWSALFALALGLAATLYAFDSHLLPRGDRPNPLGSLLGAVALITLTLGMVEYVGLPERWRRRAWWAVIGLAVLLLSLRFAGAMPRIGGFISYAAYLSFQAVLAGWAWWHEPRRGHALVLMALLLYPAAVVAAVLGLIDPPLVRYLIIVPTAVLGTTVLTTGLLRAQREAGDEITRRRAAEEALRALNASLDERVAQRTEELSEMVAGLESFNRMVSHDLRGPLGGMAGLLQMAERALATHDLATVQRILPVVQRQAQTSADLVAALLELARVGEAPLQPRPVALASVVGEALAQLSQPTPALGKDARHPAVHVQALPELTADPTLLRQLYVNLIGNALKFSREVATPRVEVGFLLHEGQTLLFVRDNGVGFASEAAPQLFTPFARLHSGQFEGTGVGLSIVKRIVERHQGHIWAESAPGQGATFYFTLGPMQARTLKPALLKPALQAAA